MYFLRMDLHCYILSELVLINIDSVEILKSSVCVTSKRAMIINTLHTCSSGIAFCLHCSVNESPRNSNFL